MYIFLTICTGYQRDKEEDCLLDRIRNVFISSASSVNLNTISHDTINSGCDLLVDLLQQSRLGVLAQVELAAEFFDYILGDLTFINGDVLHVITAVKLYLEHANRLLIKLVVGLTSARGIARSLLAARVRSVLSIGNLTAHRLSLGGVGGAISQSSLRLLRVRNSRGRHRLILVARDTAVSATELRLSRHRIVSTLASARAEG